MGYFHGLGYVKYHKCNKMNQFKWLKKYFSGFVGGIANKTSESARIWQRLSRSQSDFIEAISNRKQRSVLCALVNQLTDLLEEIEARIWAIPGAEQLNPREFQVLFLMLQGASSKELANQLVLSHSYVNNVRSHVRAALRVPVDQRIEDFVRRQVEQNGIHEGRVRRGGARGELSTALRALNEAAACDQLDKEWGEPDYSDLERCTAELQKWLPQMMRFEAEFADDRIQRDRFTSKEWQVIQLIVRGHSAKSIREVIGCSRSNVYRLRGAVREKLGLRWSESLNAFLIQHVKH